MDQFEIESCSFLITFDLFKLSSSIPSFNKSLQQASAINYVTNPAPLKQSASNRNYFNSVLQNRDPFSVYPQRHQQRLNNINNMYRAPAPILTNNVSQNHIGQSQSQGSRNMMPGRCNSNYMDRGHPDGMPVPGDTSDSDVRWQHEDRRTGSGPYPGQSINIQGVPKKCSFARRAQSSLMNFFWDTWYKVRLGKWKPRDNFKQRN